MCQKCNCQAAQIEITGSNDAVVGSVKQHFAQAGDAGVAAGIDSKGILHGIGMSAGTPPVLLGAWGVAEEGEDAAPEPGEVLVNADYSVTHSTPDTIEELAKMIHTLNGCQHFRTESQIQKIVTESALLLGDVHGSRRVNSADEAEDILDEHKMALARIMVMAMSSFAFVMKGADYSYPPSAEELAAELLSYTADAVADEVADKVGGAIDNVMNDMGLKVNA